MADRILYLVRHGQYDSENAPDDLGGSLTEMGRTQALLAAQRLSTLPIRAVHYSTLRRSAETAQIIAATFPGVERHPSELLWECIPCLPATFPEMFAHISKEKLRRHERQAQQAFKQYFAPARDTDRHEILVTHGNLLRYFVCRSLSAPPQTWTNTDVNNCGISVVVVQSEGRLMLVSHNETGHLPDHLRTYT